MSEDQRVVEGPVADVASHVDVAPAALDDAPPVMGAPAAVVEAAVAVTSRGLRSPRPRRKGVPGRTRLDFWIDLALLVAFVLDYSFRFTGLTVHEWIGLGFGVALLVHVTLHWDWVLRTTKRVLARLPWRERLRWIIDLGLMLVMTLCVASGVLISRSALPALGIRPVAGGFWTGLHTTTADLTVALVGVHVGLNWRWILSVGRRLLRRRAKAAS